MDWDERRRFNASEPDPGGLAAMAAELSPGSSVVETRRLAGGVDAATHAVRLDPGGWLVVKRTTPANAGSLEGEFTRLEFVQRVSIATPDPIGIDSEGSWFGHPALVMRLLPGQNTFHEGVGPWIDALAQTLAGIHSTPLDDAPPRALRATHAGLHWEPAPPDELARTAPVAALIEAGLSLRHEPGPDGDVLLHHDFHHGNVLWDGTTVSGVIDWNEARLGPAACDVAYCSVDLAMTHGLEASTRFLTSYRAVAGPVSDLDRWRCLWTANAMRWIPNWIDGFADAGIDLSLPTARRRLDDLADHVLADR